MFVVFILVYVFFEPFIFRAPGNNPGDGRVFWIFRNLCDKPCLVILLRWDHVDFEVDGLHDIQSLGRLEIIPQAEAAIKNRRSFAEPGEPEAVEVPQVLVGIDDGYRWFFILR